MRALILASAMAAAWTSPAAAAEPAPLTDLHVIHSLTRAEARRGLPVTFEGVVTYYNSADVDLFVQDGNDAIYVETKPNQALALGDRVHHGPRTPAGDPAPGLTPPPTRSAARGPGGSLPLATSGTLG